MASDTFDVVLTWVDDSFPGYLELLNQYANDKRDLNPNRTRDNLQLLRFALRSVERYVPRARRIYILTCRPQIPNWLDANHPSIQVVHHDEIIAPDCLPTFSSFAIVSHLHLLPGVSSRFLYLEDDMMLNSDQAVSGLLSEDGRPIVNLSHERILPKKNLSNARSSPWNLALAHADEVLAGRFGLGPRRHTIHGPRMIDRDAMEAAEAEYPEVFAATRKARFRQGETVPPEVFVPHYMIETGAAVQASQVAARRMEGYASLENFAPWTWAQLKRLDLRKPLSITLNDSFSEKPNARVERMVSRWLQTKFPTPAAWERTGFS